MLAEARCKKILDILDSMGSVTVQQLMDELDTSESTIRRDPVSYTHLDVYKRQDRWCMVVVSSCREMLG